MNSKNRELKHYMALPYTVMLQRDEEGDFIARVKELDGCVADGQDEMEALGNLQEVKEFWLAAALRAGRKIPLPSSIDDELPSGKWLTRVPRSLHKKVAELAEREGVSLNQFVAVCLAEAVGQKTASLRDQCSMPAILNQVTAAAQTSSYKLSAIHVVDTPSTQNASWAQTQSFLKRAVVNETYSFKKPWSESPYSDCLEGTAIA